MGRSIYVALTAFLLLVTSSKAAPTQPQPPATEEEMDRQIGDMLQKLESAKNLNPREKRAVNVLSGLLGGGGGGGNFLNELNKGPTYSQLLGNGGGFNKAGLLSGFLGSSSGTAIFNRRPLVSLSVGGGAGIIDDDPEAVALRLNLEQQREHNPLDLGGPQGGVSAHLAIPLRGPLGHLFTPPPSLPAEDYDVVDEDYPESDPDDSYRDEEDVEVRNLPVNDNKDSAVLNGPYPPEAPDVAPPSGPYAQEAPDPMPSGGVNPPEVPDPTPPRQPSDLLLRDPDTTRRPRKHKGGGGRGNRGGRFQKDGNGGASAGASVSGGDASAGAAAGGGSDSGSILSLVTPLLGSSSAGAAGGGNDGGAGASLGVSLGGGGGGGANAVDLWRETMSLHYRIKSFIFRKLAQLLGSSSGSPQAG